MDHAGMILFILIYIYLNEFQPYDVKLQGIYRYFKIYYFLKRDH